VLCQLGVDDWQNLGAQVVFFEPVSKPQNADPIGNAQAVAFVDDVTEETGLKQSLFGPQVQQASLMLHAVSDQ
jgi:hypothetical protein